MEWAPTVEATAVALINSTLPSRDAHQRHAGFRRVRIDPGQPLGEAQPKGGARGLADADLRPNPVIVRVKSDLETQGSQCVDHHLPREAVPRFVV
jgi:hypothetical protein